MEKTDKISVWRGTTKSGDVVIVRDSSYSHEYRKYNTRKQDLTIERRQVAYTNKQCIYEVRAQRGCVGLGFQGMVFVYMLELSVNSRAGFCERTLASPCV